MRLPAVLSRPSWRAWVPVVCLLAGFGFAVSAHQANGTELRAPNNTNLAALVASAEAQVQADNRTVDRLQAAVSAAAAAVGSGNSAVAGAQASVAALRAPGGLTSASGPGIEVVLDDAPTQISGVDPNQLVVHQSDLQGVVNSLWAGGAEAMTIVGQRVIATSAVRCVGNTLLLNGQVYSPPFRVQAIGPYATMQSTLDESPAVRLFKQAAQYYGLGYTVESRTQLNLPPYGGSIALIYANPVTK
ncbi:MAG: DUF881 domain-containing protein [Actinomycetota bacterium]|nr:DUF881 domain-containing protein [Actinomycetota bacterium]